MFAKIKKRNKKIISFIIVFLFIISFWVLSFYLYGFDEIIYQFLTIGFLIFGLIFSSLKYFLENKKKNIMFYFFISSFVSLWTFAKLHENADAYITALRSFAIAYSSLILIVMWKKIVLKITESYSFLITISFVYWFLESEKVMDYWLFLLTLPFIILVFFHAFSNSKIGNNSKIILSLWSSIVLFIFTYDYIKNIYFSFTEKTMLVNYQDYFLIPFEYFSAGMMILYVISNFYLFWGYLPALKFGVDSLDIIKDMNKINMDRYNDSQSSIKNSIFILFSSIIIYGLNHYFKIIPVYSMIFLTFFLLSAAGIVESWRGKKIKNNI